MSEEEELAWYEDPDLKSMMGLMGCRALRGIVCTFNGNRIYGGKTGLGAVANLLSKEFEDDEKRVLIIADSFTIKFAPKITEVFQLLGFECKQWNGCEPEVPLSTIEKGVQVCQEFKPKVLLAVGGGSVMDTGKVLMIKYQNPETNLLQLDPRSAVLGLRKKIKRYVVIPTTSGTGSEVTTGSVVTDTRRTPHKKIEVAAPETLPDMVILDTDFVKDMPPFLTMATGLDAFAHSMGAYVSNWNNPLTTALNEVAIKLVMKYLGRAVKYGAKDLEAREQMQWAALIAGMGFINAMVGIDHSLGHSFGAVMKVHHGLSVGLFTPQSIAYQAKVTQRWKGLCPFFGIDPKKNVSREKLLTELLDAIKGYIKSVGGITAVKECKNPVINKEDYMANLDILAQYADNDIFSLTSFRPINFNMYRKIYEFAWEGKLII